MSTESDLSIGPLVSRIFLPPGVSRSTPSVYDQMYSAEHEGLASRRSAALSDVCYALACEARGVKRARRLFKEISYHSLAMRRNSQSQMFCRTAIRFLSAL